MARQKNDGFVLPQIVDPPRKCVKIWIPNEVYHRGAFWGAIFELTQSFNWQQNPPETAREVANLWYDIWLQATKDNDMDGCCADVAVTFRIDPTSGVIQQSTNGGVSWTPAANGLPSVIVNPVPPITSGVADTKCDAATNLKAQIDVWVAQVSTDFETAGNLVEFATAVFVAILAAVLVILSAGALTPIQALVIPALGAALSAAWGAGKAAFDAYWTVEVNDAILCAALCNIGEDGSFSAAQFTAFWQELNVNLPPSPAKMLFMGFLSSVDKEGLNAMAASGTSADADCGECECSDFVRLFVSPGGGTETGWDGEWLYASPVHDGDHYTLFVQRTVPTDPFNQDLCASIEIELLTGTIDVPNSAMRLCHAAGLVPIGIAAFPGTCVCQVAIRNFEDVPFTVRMRGTACT